MKHQSCILLFIKDPEPGDVKTRLAEKVGKDAAAKIYRCFVLDTLSKLTNLNIPITIFFDPPSAAERISHWLGPQYSYQPQSGHDLGEKMKNAFAQSFDQGCDRLILIGSDIPDLPAEFIRQACEALESKDAVIGPTSDGGYYLIGFTKEKFIPQAFEQIEWSAPKTFEQTMQALNSHNLTTHILPQWHDIDTLTDLSELVMRNHDTPFQKSSTYVSILDTNEETSK